MTSIEILDDIRNQMEESKKKAERAGQTATNKNYYIGYADAMRTAAFLVTMIETMVREDKL